MKSHEFLEEALNSEICPPDFEKVYGEFQMYQKAAIDTLNELHRVCEQNKIPYQLAYGSLIGAVRDGGQIPWDYDVDVFVPYEEKDHLIQALKRDLNEKYYFYCPEVDKKCRHAIMRLAPKGYRSEALHVDVFYLIGLPGEENRQVEFKERVKKLSSIRYAKLVNIREESRGRMKALLRMTFERLKCVTYDLSSCEKELAELCSRYRLSESEFCISMFVGGSKTYSTKAFLETTRINTSTGEYYIPKRYDEILKQMYGDYTKILPLKDRIDEMYRSYRNLKYFESL